MRGDKKSLAEKPQGDPDMSPAATAGKQVKEAFLLLTLGDPNGLGPELACLIGDGLCQGSETVLLLGAEQALAWH